MLLLHVKPEIQHSLLALTVCLGKASFFRKISEFLPKFREFIGNWNLF